MKIYFVRHGQTQSNKERIIVGHKDSPLTEEGLGEVRETAQKLSTDFDIIYSSDLGRVAHTAKVLNEKLKLSIVLDTRLRERNFGSLEGKKTEEVPDVWEKDHNQQYDYRPFGGESVEDVKNRLLDFISNIQKKQKGKKVLVVTHAGIIRLLHHLLKGKIPEKIHNASIHEFDFPDK